MYISKLFVKNFRNFNNIQIDLQEGLNVIVGPNNVGKSNFIDIISYLNKDPNTTASIDDFNKYILNANIERYKVEPPLIEIEYTIEHDLNFEVEDSAFSKLSNILVFDSVTGDINMDENNQSAHLIAKTCLKYEYDIKEIEEYKKEMKHVNDFTSFYNVLIKLQKNFRWKFYNYTTGMDLDKKIINNIFEIDMISASRSIEGITDHSKKYVNERIKENNIDVFDIKHDINKKIQEKLELVKKQIDDDINEDQKQIGITNGKNKFVSNFIFDAELSDFFKYELEDDMMGFPLPLEYNGLGYNNLIYIRNLLKQKKNNDYNVILLEEPEAHLHPNMQYKLLCYVNDLKEQKKGDVEIKNQIFVTTHSSNITAKLKTKDIILFSMDRSKNPPENMAINLSNNFDYSKLKDILNISEDNKELLVKAEEHLEKFLDVTRSDILFSEKVILVEGLAEKLLIPKFYPGLIDEHITIIELGGINFNYFLPLAFNSNKKVLCITDKDKEIIIETGNELQLDIANYNSNESRIDTVFTSLNNQIKVCQQTQYGSTFEKELFIENYNNAFEILLKLALPDNFSELIKHNSMDFWNNNFKKYILNGKQKNFISNMMKKYIKLRERNEDNEELIEKMFFTDLFYSYVKNKKGKFALELFDYKEVIKMPKYIEEGIQWLKA